MGKRRMKLRKFMVVMLSAALIANMVNWQDLAALAEEGWAEETVSSSDPVAGAEPAGPEETVSGSDPAAGAEPAGPEEMASGAGLAPESEDMPSEGTVSGSDPVAGAEPMGPEDVLSGEEPLTEEELTADGPDLAVAGEYVPLYSETVDLGSTVTSGETWDRGMLFSADTVYPSLFNAGGGTGIGRTSVKGESAVNWIDRLNIPDYGRNLYNILVEGADGDGTEDCLIDDAYFSYTGEHVVDITYDGGVKDIFNGICVLDTEYASNKLSSADQADISVTMRAAFDAFDRDRPEVFWLTGATQAKFVLSGKVYSDGTTTYRLQAYLVLKTHVNASGGPLFDARVSGYRTEAGIRAGIGTVNAQVDAIRSGEPADVVGKIRWYNEWLTRNNEYNTGDLNNGPEDMRECINALTGREGTAGPVCESYARAFKVLCDRAGIPCVLVDGKANPPGTSVSEEHMWNYVQVEDAWYAADVTWDDPKVSGKSGKVSGSESEDWLLVGANTVFKAGGSGVRFLESHPPTNCASEGGLAFTNGPTLCPEEYKAPKSVTLTGSAALVYGYGSGPGVGVQNGTPDSYQWYRKGDPGPTALSGAVSAVFPTGQAPGTYFCRVTFNDGDGADSPDVTVAQKKITAVLSGTAVKDYDGTADVPAGNLLVLALEGVEDADSGSVGVNGGTYVYANGNAGEDKRITASGIVLSGEKASCYLLASDTVSANVGAILPKDISVGDTVVETEGSSLIYNGKEQTVRVSLVTADGLTVPAEDYAVVGNSALEVGNYTYKVQITNSDSNFTGAVIRSYTIDYLAAPVTMLYNGDEHVKTWYRGPVTVTADGYTVSDAADGDFAESYGLSDEGVNPPHTLYFKNSAGYITAGLNTEVIRIDGKAPAFSGEDGIAIETHRWNKLLKTVTFGLFFRETKTVTVTAQETGSGIANYYYYLDNGAGGAVLTSAELDAVPFEKLPAGQNTFPISDEKNYVIYAYATDVAGNRSSYISSEGIVLDKSAPVLTVQADGGRLGDVTAVVRFEIDEPAKILYQYYKNGEAAPGTWTAFSDAEEYTAKGEYSIKLTGLEQNTLYVFTVRATDRAGNVSEPKTISFGTKLAVPEFDGVPVITGVYGQRVEEMELEDLPVSTNGVSGAWKIGAGQTDRPGVGTSDEYDVVFVPEDEELYSWVTVKVRPRISKKTIHVTIDPKERKRGEDNPQLTFRCNADELVGDDTEADLGITLTTAAGKDSDAGDYEITGTSVSEDYDVIFTAGILTVREAAGRPKLPYITDEKGAEGWEAITGRLEAVGEGSLNVDMCGTTEVAGSVFDALRGKDVTVTFDMGEIVWSVNGQKVLGEGHGAINLGVTWDDGSIPEAAVAELVQGSYGYRILTLLYSGAFGLEAKLTAIVDSGLKYAGKRANLFYYDPKDGSMEFICDAEIRADGRAELTFSHASDYVVVIADASMKPADSVPPTGSIGGGSSAGAGAEPPAGTGGEASAEPAGWVVIESVTETRKPIDINEQAPKTGEEDLERRIFSLMLLFLLCMAAAKYRLRAKK